MLACMFEHFVAASIIIWKVLLLIAVFEQIIVSGLRRALLIFLAVHLSIVFHRS